VRSVTDVDLLVAPGTIDAAIACLVDHGGRRLEPEVRPGFDARFAKDVPIVMDGVAVDLHRTLVAGPFGERVPLEQIFRRHHAVPIGGITLPGLDPADAYVHAAITAGIADVPARLITLRDLLELSAAVGFDAELVAARAREWRAEAPMARAMEVLARELAPDPSPQLLAWASRYRPSRRDRWYVRTYLGGGRSYRRALATLGELGTWSARARYLRAVASPQAEYLAARGWNRRRHLERAVERLTRS
jgi:Uncharacterised nucleotidyltransferase